MTHFIDLAKYAPILKLRLNAFFAKKKNESMKVMSLFLSVRMFLLRS